MFLENIIPPIPSEIIMPLGGFFVYQQKLNFYILVFWGLLGTILGSLPWYYLGRLVNEKRLSNFLDKQGKYLGISSNDLSKSKRWFDKYGVFFSFLGSISTWYKNFDFSSRWHRTYAIRKIFDLDYIWELDMGSTAHLCRLFIWRKLFNY